jgi:hypothetical protein
MFCAACQILLGIDPTVSILDDGGVPNGPAGDGGDSGLGGDGDGPDANGGDAGCTEAGCVVVLAHATGKPTDIAVDDAFVYWSSDDGSLGRVGKDGLGAKPLVSGVQGTIDRLALTTSRLYFLTNQGQDSDQGAIFTTDKDGLGQKPVATGLHDIWGLAASGSSVYWVSNDATQVGSVVGALVPTSGSATVAPLYAGRGYLLDIAADDTTLYWVEDYGTVRQAPASGGGSVVALADCGNTIGAFAIDQNSVYFSTQTGAQLERTPKSEAVSPEGGCNSPSRRTLALGETKIAGVAIGGGFAWWTSSSAGTVKAIEVTGGCSAAPCGQLRASGQSSPGRMTADANAVYWVNTVDQSIMMLKF